MSLFPASIIPQSIKTALPGGYTCRPLRRTDHKAGFLDVLRVLTKVGDIPESDFVDRFDWLRSRNPDVAFTTTDSDGKSVDSAEAVAKTLEDGEYFIICIVNENGTVVGTGSLLVERKFIRNLGKVGHIEDIAVAKDQQGKKLGLRLIQALDHISQQAGCYKTLLDCSEANEGFYHKCGFKRAGLCMSHYYDQVGNPSGDGAAQQTQEAAATTTEESAESGTGAQDAAPTKTSATKDS